MVGKLYDESGGVSGLITEKELKMYQRREQLSTENFINRNNQFTKKRDEKIVASQSVNALRELDNCTFTPELYNTK